MRLSYWFPVAVIVIGIAALLNFSLLTPLPANGYGRTIYDVHTIFSVLEIPAFASWLGASRRFRKAPSSWLQPGS